MPKVNVTNREMQSAARQLQAGEQQIEGDLSKLKRLVDQLIIEHRLDSRRFGSDELPLPLSEHAE